MLGKDYSAAPTCASCHISAYMTPQGKAAANDHDVGRRISWTLRPVISAKMPNWQERREAMKGVCLNCHSSSHVDNFYKQFDDLVLLYNDKFARTAQKLMDELAADKVLKPNAPFEHRVQWVFYELWHHEGRRARHGAAMMGPDFTHWHGMYEVAKHFYLEFLPEVVAAAALKGPELRRKYERRVEEILSREEHIWKRGGP